jgi:hypothetical protein
VVPRAKATVGKSHNEQQRGGGPQSPHRIGAQDEHSADECAGEHRQDRDEDATK